MLEGRDLRMQSTKESTGRRGVTPTMRLYLPRVEARLRGITALWFCRKKGHLHTIPCNEGEWDKELAYNRHFTQYINIDHTSSEIHT